MFKIVALGESNTFGYPEDKIQRSETYTPASVTIIPENE